MYKMKIFLTYQNRQFNMTHKDVNIPNNHIYISKIVDHC